MIVVAPNKREYISIALIALFLAAAMFILQGRIGLNIADEGFLWYGVQRTAVGESPIIDFQSYDPGRYYWSAPFLKVFGNSLTSLRLSFAGLQFVGLLCGLSVLRRVISSYLALTLSGLLMIVWMVPSYRSYDHVTVLIALILAVRLLEKPDRWRFASWGVWLPVTAIIGRNHLLYGTVAFALIAAYLLLTAENRRKVVMDALWVPLVIAIMAGICFLLRPQQVVQLISDYYWYIKRGSLKAEFFKRTLDIPVPWPWKPVNVLYGAMHKFSNIYGRAIGVLFIVLPVFYVALGWNLISNLMKGAKRSSPVFVAIFCVGMPYVHNAFSRADLEHLAHGIQPLLIGSVCLLSFHFGPRVRLLGGLWLSAVIVLSMMTTPLYNGFTLKLLSPKDQFKTIRIGDSTFDVNVFVAQAIEGTLGFLDGRLGKDQKVLVAPHWTTLYPILNRKAPLWKTYFLTADPKKMQREMIAQLKGQDIPFAVLGDVALDGRNDLKFSNTDALLWNYIMENYVEVNTVALPEPYKIYRYCPPIGTEGSILHGPVLERSPE